MKLASLKGGKDGRLVVVSNDLAWCAEASAIAPTLQAALDDWSQAEPKLRGLAESLEHGSVPRERFHEHDALSPLPRAYQWADGAAYWHHIDLIRQVRGGKAPADFPTEPLMRQGSSDRFMAPREPVRLVDEAWGWDLEGELAVITGDLQQGATRGEALSAIRLVMLANDFTLRNLVALEAPNRLGFVQAKPPPAFSPVAVTPDSLEGWRDGKLSGVLEVELNGKPLGQADTGADVAFDFGALVAYLAKTRAVAAGSIVGSGTVSNRGPGGTPGKPIAEGGVGYSCLAELRTYEASAHGAPRTPFLARGDRLRIEMRDGRRHSIFGAIEQEVVAG